MSEQKVDIILEPESFDTFVKKIFNYDVYISELNSVFALHAENTSFTIYPDDNHIFYNILNTDSFDPNIIGIGLNTVYLKSQGDYDIGQWKQNDINYIMYKLNKIANFIDNKTIIRETFTIGSKFDKDEQHYTNQLENSTMFIRDSTVNTNNDISIQNYIMLKIPKDYSPIPMFIQNECELETIEMGYYRDISSKVDIFMKNDIQYIDYGSLYKNTYKFDKFRTFQINRMSFELKGFLITIDNIVIDSGKSYWDLNMHIDLKLHQDKNEIVENIALFLGDFREESILRKSFISKIYKTPLKTGKTYYSNPIGKPKLLNYDHLFFKSFSVDKMISYPNPDGLYVELIIGSNFFIIIIEYSVYLKRYYISENLPFDGNYTSYKCILYSSKSDPFDVLMETNNNITLKEDLNILIIEKMYTFGDNNIIIPNISGKHNFIFDSNIEEFIKYIGFNMTFVKYNKTLGTKLIDISMEDYYSKIKSLYPTTNGLNLYISSIDVSYTIYEENLYNIVLNQEGEIIITGKNSVVIRNIFDRQDVIAIFDIYGEKLGKILLENKSFYFIYNVTQYFMKSVKLYLTKRNTESRWSNRNIYLKISDFDRYNPNMYIKYNTYKTKMLIGEINKFNINLVIYIGPDNIPYLKDTYSVVLFPSRNANMGVLEEATSIIIADGELYEIEDVDGNKLETPINRVDAFIEDHKFESYILVYNNIYNTDYIEIFEKYQKNASYIIAVDLFTDTNIFYNRYNFKWDKNLKTGTHDEFTLDYKNILYDVNIEYIKPEMLNLIITPNVHGTTTLDIKYIKEEALELGYVSEKYINSLHVEYKNADYLSIDIHGEYEYSRRISKVGSKLKLLYFKRMDGVTLSNDVKTNIPSNNLYKLLVKHLKFTVFKREIVSKDKTIEDVINKKIFRIIIRSVSISFEILQIKGLLESVLYAIYSDKYLEYIDKFINDVNMLQYIDPVPQIKYNMGYQNINQIRYLSNLLKISFIFYDINITDRELLKVCHYAQMIYFITDFNEIYPIKRYNNLLEHI